MNPPSQEYVALSPICIPADVSTLPLAGSLRIEHPAETLRLKNCNLVCFTAFGFCLDLKGYFLLSQFLGTNCLLI